MQSYKDLEIYKISHKLAIEVHKMTMALPSFEIYEEASSLKDRARFAYFLKEYDTLGRKINCFIKAFL